MRHFDNITLNDAIPMGKGRVLLKDLTLVRLYQTNKDPFVSNRIEEKNINATNRLPYVEKVFSFNDKTGRKESLFIRGGKKIECSNPAHIRLAATLMKTFHSSKVKLSVKVNPFARLKLYKKYTSTTPFSKEEKDIINNAKELYKCYPLVNSHNFMDDSSIIIKDDEAYLYNIEHAGKNICLFDLATFAYFFDLEEKDVDYLIECYGELNKKDVETMRDFVRIYFRCLEDYISLVEEN